MRISPFQGFVEAAKALQKCRRLCPSGWARRRSRGLRLRHLHESSSFGAAVHRASKARTARIGIVKSRYQSTKRRPQLEGLWSSAALRCPMVWLPSARDPSRWPGLHDSLEGDGFEPSVPRQNDNAFRDSSFPTCARATAAFENARRPVQQLLLPVVDRVRMNAELTRQLGDRPVPPTAATTTPSL